MHNVCGTVPGEGEMCGRLQRDANENSGTMQRGHRVRRFFSRIKGFLSANLPCEPGLICTRVNLTRKECRPENPNGKLLHGLFLVTSYWVSLHCIQVHVFRLECKTPILLVLRMGTIILCSANQMGMKWVLNVLVSM